MAWETRKSSNNRYYTRTHKEHGQYRREYVGTGEKARIAADGDAARRTAERDNRAQAAAIYAQYAQVDEALRLYYLAVDAQMKATLRAAGYHQHDRGEWRLRRGSTARS